MCKLCDAYEKLDKVKSDKQLSAALKKIGKAMLEDGADTDHLQDLVCKLIADPDVDEEVERDWENANHER